MHPEADAFLDAIFDHPDDDNTHRLVYADWLQEHDHEDYAQFIRLSVRADGGSKPPSVRQQLREERRPYWERMQERTDAFRALPLTIHGFDRGFCAEVVVKAEDFARTVATWWPAISPRRLTVFGTRDPDTNAIETEIAAIARHFPWLRELRCFCRPGMDVHDIDEYGFPPLNGSVFSALAAPGILHKLKSLDVTIAWADIPALRAFAESDLSRRLETVYLRVQFPGTDHYERIIAERKQGSDAIRLAVEAFLAEHG